MEQQLYECWRVAEKELPSLDSVRNFGKCCIRMALHVLSKESLDSFDFLLCFACSHSQDI